MKTLADIKLECSSKCEGCEFNSECNGDCVFDENYNPCEECYIQIYHGDCSSCEFNKE